MNSKLYKRLKEVVRRVINEIELDEMTGTTATPGYLTPNAFSKPSQVKKKNKKMASLAGGKLVEGKSVLHKIFK